MKQQQSLSRFSRSIMMGIAVALSLPLLGCSKQETSQGPAYSNASKLSGVPVVRFAVHPLHNPQKLSAAYGPLMDVLNQGQNQFRFELEASRDYASFEAKLAQREPEFALPNPWQTLQAMTTGYNVIAMAGSPDDFKGIILIRKDSGIKDLKQLIGKPISYPAPTALAASMMPQMYLQNHGIKVVTQTQSKYVGSQESSIMNVYLKETVAGATWPPPWRATFRAARCK